MQIYLALFRELLITRQNINKLFLNQIFLLFKYSSNMDQVIFHLSVGLKFAISLIIVVLQLNYILCFTTFYLSASLKCKADLSNLNYAL